MPAPRGATLQHPRCVFPLLRRPFSRYPPEMVERICGISREDFLTVATAYCYALGWTQRTAGGAARPRLDRHPHAPRPAARAPAHAARVGGAPRLERYIGTGGLDRGWWSHFLEYIVSLLKAWYGEAATAENDLGFGRSC